MARKSRIDGAAEMNAVLRELPDQLQRNVMRSAGNAGAKALQRKAYAYLALAMSNRSPREDDVVVRQERAQRVQTQVVFGVGPPRRKPWLRWLHDGTAPHQISAVTKFGTRRGVRNVAYGTRDSKVLADRAAGKFFGKSVTHPGQPARRWLLMAMRNGNDAVMQAMAKKLRDQLPRQVRKLVSSKFRGQVLRRLSGRRITL